MKKKMMKKEKMKKEKKKKKRVAVTYLGVTMLSLTRARMPALCLFLLGLALCLTHTPSLEFLTNEVRLVIVMLEVLTNNVKI